MFWIFFFFKASKYEIACRRYVVLTGERDKSRATVKWRAQESDKVNKILLFLSKSFHSETYLHHGLKMTQSVRKKAFDKLVFAYLGNK